VVEHDASVVPGSRTPDPCALVIFGANGDLSRRKLVPALYNLLLDESLREAFAVVGASRTDMSSEQLRDLLRKGVGKHSRRPLDPDHWADLARRISYVCTKGEDGYARLAEHLRAIEAESGLDGNRLFYLATPPSAFAAIVRGLKGAGLHRPGNGGRWSRIVVEKPIGADLDSARELNRKVNAVFDERDVFRIDHYLGKETVQNLMVFRFGNAIFEPLWNQKYVDHVQITVAESIGVEDRGRYFEEAGMARDMLQNHMMQLLTLIAMEPPSSLMPDAIRDEKVKVLEALRPVAAEHVRRDTVRARYDPGVIAGEQVPGYLDEADVAPDSRTETYVALRLHIDNWRWADVPFYLRAGKRLPKRVTEVALQFRDVPHRLFGRDLRERLQPNMLAMRIQPDEQISLRFEVKVPGAAYEVQPVAMDFHYDRSFGDPPEAYERLLLDAILGDTTLFIRRDEVEAAWTYVDRLQEGWAGQRDALPAYAAGTWGPSAADLLVDRDGRAWRKP
jgi:glucose-6-phosphate 1-dehydrogenase